MKPLGELRKTTNNLRYEILCVRRNSIQPHPSNVTSFSKPFSTSVHALTNQGIQDRRPFNMYPTSYICRSLAPIARCLHPTSSKMYCGRWEQQGKPSTTLQERLSKSAYKHLFEAALA